MVTSNDVQRLFLQAIFSRGVLSEKLAMIIWTKCIEAVKAADDALDIPNDGSRAAWDEFVGKINASLDNLDLEFRHLHDELTGRAMYALVNRRGDEVAQMATDYTAQEIAYFKAIVEQIMLTPNEAYSVSSFAALREVNTLKSNMTKTQAEIVLGSFVAKGWLLKSRRGRYSLSTRTLLELYKYLKETYGDEYLLECTICMETLTRGVACHTANCKTRMHFHCFKRFRRQNSTCPVCKHDWPQEADANPLVPVGEGAVKDGQDEVRRRVRRKDTPEESNDEGEMVDEASQSRQPKPSQPQKKKTGRSNAASIDGNEDNEDDYAPRRRNGRQ